MGERTLTALYNTRGAAEVARDELVAAGVPSADATIHGTEGGGAATDAGTGSGRGFWSNLFLPDEDRSAYEEGVKRGGYLLSARVPEGLEDEAVAVLERSEPVDLDERSAGWRRGGWTGQTEGYAAGTAGAAGAAPVLADESTHRTDTTRADHGTTGTAAARASATGALGVTGEAATGERRGTDGDAPLQVVEEQLRVGKREVGRGSVRVRSYVTERPVEEQVALRQERVTIERRPVDRELRADDPAFEERTIEVVERGEEAVVSKTARVVEEVAVGKEVERETETVRDTVRRQDVEVDDDRTGRDPGVTGTTTESDTTVTGTTSGTDRTPLDPTTR